MAWKQRQTRSPLTAEEARASVPVLQQLAADFWLYVTSCVQTLDEHEQDPALSISKPFPRYPYLREIASDLQKLPVLRRLLILKSRQMLVSWLLAAFATWLTLFHNGNRVLYLTIRESDSFKMKARVDHILAHLPDLVRVMLDQRDVDNTGEITFRGGSAMQFLPSSDNPGRSLTASLVILDEHGFHPHDLKMYAAIKPTVSGGGMVISNSTPNGVGNLFHQLTVGARRGIRHPKWNGYHYREVRWQMHPERDQAWFNDVTRDMPSRLVAQEYLLDFTQSGSPVFQGDYLKAPACRPMLTPDQLGAGRPQEVADAIHQARRAGLDIPFYLAGDVGEGVEGGDPSTATVIEARTGRQAATIRYVCRPDIFAAKVAQLAQVFPGIIAIEKNGPGGTVLLELERLGLGGRLYRHREWDERGRKKTRLGWVTSSKSKPLMIDELEVALRLKQVQVSDQETLDQLQVYQYTDGMKQHGSGAPSGYHDDDVIALAIAWQMRKSASQVLGVIG